MSEIPKWDDAIDQFKTFLRSFELPIEIEWILREDIWKQSAQDMLVRNPVCQDNVTFCHRIFEAGRDK